MTAKDESLLGAWIVSERNGKKETKVGYLLPTFTGEKAKDFKKEKKY